MAAALYLDQRGLEVTLLESGPSLGGRAATYGCKATDRCLQCGVCLVHDLLDQVAASGVAVRRGATLERLETVPGGFSAWVRLADGALVLVAAAAVIVATGLEPFDATRLPDLGYGRVPGVLTATDLEQQLKTAGGLYLNGTQARRVAFMQCVGSRNLQLGADYCSEVCCQYALRMALGLRADYPETEVTMFYMDLQTHGRGFDQVYREAAEQVRLVAGVPTEVRALPGGGLRVQYEDVWRARVATAEFDALVLAHGIRPARAAAELGLLLGLNCDQHGFFATSSRRSGATNRPGIYVTGCAAGPGGIADSIARARACAAEAAAGLEVESA